MWWLPVAAGVLLLAAGWLTAVRSRPRTPARHNAVRLAVALAMAALMVCLAARVFGTACRCSASAT
ncbi:Integral membrane protein OS=Streptomyces fumanus OX=67302 GN=GCM10018772_54990 PE=4 SV=1 [Streptomyces fumanus]